MPPYLRTVRSSLRPSTPATGKTNVRLSAPRWLHRLYAGVAGYFWLQCPRCDRWFGGHEIGGTVWEDETRVLGKVTCRCCPGEWVISSSGIKPLPLEPVL